MNRIFKEREINKKRGRNLTVIEAYIRVIDKKIDKEMGEKKKKASNDGLYSK